tara:strand:- start:41100 stop:41702 length:603 start_codon:yes stop_codon:yes gene_type:complete
MNIADAIQQRRAVKHFDPAHEMPEDEFKSLMELVLQSPTSFNIQNWRFVRITDKAKRAELRAAAWDQAQVTDASVVLLLCADLKAWDKDPARYWRNAPDEVAARMVPMIGSFYEGREWIQRDEAMRSVGMAAQSLMLTAKSMGYDSCPMIGFDQDAAAKIVNLPADHAIGMMVTIGKQVKAPNPRGGSIEYSEAVIDNAF